jgi:hypothetical protein
MKTLRRSCATLVLTLALSLSAFAGDMSAGITAPPPPSQSVQGDITTGVAGDMGAGITGEIQTGVTAIDPATDIFLSLLQSLLSLF